MEKDILKVLISEEELKKRTAEMAEEITEYYKGRPLLVVTVLKGSFIFAADLMRAIKIPAEIDFMVLSSYGASTTTSGVVQIRKDLDRDIKDAEILIVEDILDSGMTLSYLKNMLLSRGAKSVRICTILNKPSRRKADITPDYVGFDVPDEFVVGYGLDYAEKYRNLPYVGILKREVYEN